MAETSSTVHTDFCGLHLDGTCSPGSSRLPPARNKGVMGYAEAGDSSSVSYGSTAGAEFTPATSHQHPVTLRSEFGREAEAHAEAPRRASWLRRVVVGSMGAAMVGAVALGATSSTTTGSVSPLEALGTRLSSSAAPFLTSATDGASLSETSQELSLSIGSKYGIPKRCYTHTHTHTHTHHCLRRRSNSRGRYFCHHAPPQPEGCH